MDKKYIINIEAIVEDVSLMIRPLIGDVAEIGSYVNVALFELEVLLREPGYRNCVEDITWDLLSAYNIPTDIKHRFISTISSRIEKTLLSVMGDIKPTHNYNIVHESDYDYTITDQGDYRNERIAALERRVFDLEHQLSNKE